MSGSNRGKCFALGLVVGLVIALLFLFWSVPEFRNPIQYIGDYHTETSHTNQQPNNQEDSHFWVSYFYGWVFSEDSLAQWLMAAFAMLATGASFYAVILLHRTLKTTRDLNSLTSEAFLNEQRPWLKVTPNNFIEIGRTEANWFSFYAVTIENVGKSPAVDITYHTKTILIDGSNNPTNEIEIFRKELLIKARKERVINFGVMYPVDEPRPISIDNEIIFESKKNRTTGFVMYGVSYMQPGIEKIFLVMDGVFFISPTSDPSMIGFDPKIVSVGEKMSFNISLPTIYKYLETHDRKIGT